MGRLLDAVERQLERFDRGETPDYDILQGVLDYALTYPDLYHHPKEDLVYARLRLRDPAAADSLTDLQAEHHTLAEVTRRFCAASCKTWRCRARLSGRPSASSWIPIANT